MAARIALLACLLGSVPAAARERDPKEDPGFLRDVKGAIEGGVGWLLEQQATNGTFPGFEDPRGVVYGLGMHSLATLAVIKGGHPMDSPEVFKALRQMRRLYDRNRAILKTYEVGLTLMVLEAKYFAEPPFTDRRQRRRPKKRDPRIDESDRAWATEMALWLQTKQRPPGLWRYPELGMDLSNTQYAALGLWAAHKLGARIEPGVVRRMLEETLDRQQAEGKKVPFILDPELHRRGGERRSTTMIDARGWRYMPPETLVGPDGRTRTVTYPYSGSMTSAGIAILAIGRDILGEDDLWLDAARDRKLRRAMWEGFGWIQGNWDLEDNPGQPGNWPFYWLYGLERCCRLAGLEYVGPHDWYLMGARRLIIDQREDGSWPKTQRMRPPDDQNVRWWSDQVDTAFAVLFLVRGTPELDIPPPTITGGGD